LFLWLDDTPDRAAKVRGKHIVVSPGTQHVPMKVPSGLIHHWIAPAFMADLGIADVLPVVRDYNRFKNEQDGNRVSDGDHPRAIPGPEPVDRHRHSGPNYRSLRTCSTGRGKGKPGFAGHMIRSGSAKGQPEMLASVASCFVSTNARIRKHEDDWILESSEFSSCTTGEQVFPIADGIVTRIHCILPLYCGASSTLSAKHVSWINAQGEELRSVWVPYPSVSFRPGVSPNSTASAALSLSDRRFSRR